MGREGARSPSEPRERGECRGGDAGVLSFAIAGGSGLAAALATQWRWPLLGQGVVFIRDGKGKRDRVVPLLGRAADAMDIYLREARPALLKDPRERALFLTRHGTRLRKKVIQYLVRMNAQKAEIPQPLSPHQLRHACATNLLKGGADVRHVQKLLGHQSLDSTAIYTRVAPLELKQAIEKAHPREKNWRPKKSRE